MSSASLVNLPEEFLLHTQSTRKEPWSHYVLVRKTTGLDGKTRLALSPNSFILVPPEEPAHYTKGSTVYIPDSTLQNLPIVSTDNAALHVVSFKRCKSTTVQIHSNAATPMIIPILYTSKYRSLIGKGVRANFTVAALPAPTVIPSSPLSDPAPIVIPSPSAIPPSPIPPPLSAPAETIAHINPPTAPTKPKKVSKPAAATTTATKGDLTPFVAKQLLALAKIRHEICPIVAEEYSDGNTAVMPCGHLFAQIAIEESFKKTPNTCPACRAYGRPTYV